MVFTPLAASRDAPPANSHFLGVGPSRSVSYDVPCRKVGVLPACPPKVLGGGTGLGRGLADGEGWPRAPLGLRVEQLTRARVAVSPLRNAGKVPAAVTAPPRVGRGGNGAAGSPRGPGAPDGGGLECVGSVRSVDSDQEVGCREAATRSHARAVRVYGQVSAASSPCVPRSGAPPQPRQVPALAVTGQQERGGGVGSDSL